MPKTLKYFFSFVPDPNIKDQDQRNFLNKIWETIQNCTNTVECYSALIRLVLDIAHRDVNLKLYQKYLKYEELYFFVVDETNTDLKSRDSRILILELDKDKLNRYIDSYHLALYNDVKIQIKSILGNSFDFTETTTDGITDKIKKLELKIISEYAVKKKIDINADLSQIQKGNIDELIEALFTALIEGKEFRWQSQLFFSDGMDETERETLLLTIINKSEAYFNNHHNIKEYKNLSDVVEGQLEWKHNTIILPPDVFQKVRNENLLKVAKEKSRLIFKALLFPSLGAKAVIQPALLSFWTMHKKTILLDYLNGCPKKEDYSDYNCISCLIDEVHRLLDLIELKTIPDFEKAFKIKRARIKALEIFPGFKKLRNGIRHFSTLDSIARPLIDFPQSDKQFLKIKFLHCEWDFFYIEDTENPTKVYIKGNQCNLVNPDKNEKKSVEELFFKATLFNTKLYNWTALYLLNTNADFNLSDTSHWSEILRPAVIWHVSGGNGHGIGRADRSECENYLWEYCGKPAEPLLKLLGVSNAEKFGDLLAGFLQMDPNKKAPKTLPPSATSKYAFVPKDDLKYVCVNTPYEVGADKAATLLNAGDEKELLSIFQFNYYRKINQNNTVDKKDDKNAPFSETSLPISFRLSQNHKLIAERTPIELTKLKEELEDVKEDIKEINYFKELKAVPSDAKLIKEFNLTLEALIDRLSEGPTDKSAMAVDHTKLLDFLQKSFILKKRKMIKNKDNKIVSNNALRENAGIVMKGVIDFIKRDGIRNMFSGALSATKFTKAILSESEPRKDWENLKDVVFLELPTDQEWCHLYGHGDGGNETITNFVSGSKHCNTEQLAIEAGHRMITLKAGGSYSLKSTAYLLDVPIMSDENTGTKYLNGNHNKRKREAQLSKNNAPIAAFVRYKIYKNNTKVFDYIFEGQSEFFDENQYRILNKTVYFMLAGKEKFIEWFKKSMEE